MASEVSAHPDSISGKYSRIRGIITSLIFVPLMAWLPSKDVITDLELEYLDNQRNPEKPFMMMYHRRPKIIEKNIFEG